MNTQISPLAFSLPTVQFITLTKHPYTIIYLRMELNLQGYRATTRRQFTFYNSLHIKVLFIGRKISRGMSEVYERYGLSWLSSR